jgi:hypothetical protein
MSDAKDPNDMSAAELEAYIARLEVDLEDVQEEQQFVLGQTGLHVSAKSVNKFESQIEAVKRRIEEAQGLLAAKNAAS